jgi:hypothetical protein
VHERGQTGVTGHALQLFARHPEGPPQCLSGITKYGQVTKCGQQKIRAVVSITAAQYVVAKKF